MHAIILTWIIGRCLNYLLRAARRRLSDYAFTRLVNNTSCYPYSVEWGTDLPLQIYIPTDEDYDLSYGY